MRLRGPRGEGQVKAPAPVVRPSGWVPSLLRLAMLGILVALALATPPPFAPAFAALTPFFLLGLFVRGASVAYLLAGLGIAFEVGPSALLQSWFLAGIPVALASLLLGAGRWALDPVRTGVVWARGVGDVLGNHPTNKRWRALVQRQLEDQAKEGRGDRRHE